MPRIDPMDTHTDPPTDEMAPESIRSVDEGSAAGADPTDHNNGDAGRATDADAEGAAAGSGAAGSDAGSGGGDVGGRKDADSHPDDDNDDGAGHPVVATHFSTEPFWFSKQLYNRSKIVAFSVIATVILLFMAAVQLPTTIDTTGDTFVITSSATARKALGYEYAQVDVASPLLDEDVRQHPQTEFNGFVSWYFLLKGSAKRDGSSIFERDNLQDILDLERAVYGAEGFTEHCITDFQLPGSDVDPQCARPRFTFFNLFLDRSLNSSAYFSTIDSYELPDQETIDLIVANVSTIIERNPDSPLGYFVGAEFSVDNPTTSIGRTELLLGAPLEGFNNADVAAAKQEDQAAKWAVKHVKGKLDSFSSPEVEVLYFGTGLTEAVFNEVLLNDGLFTFGALAFVWIYMTYHTRSLMLSSFGMLQILMALPLAFFVYRVLFQNDQLSVLSVLSLFLLAGIGADDIFVFLDAWKQAPGYIPGIDGVHRLSWSYRRSVTAMLWTSLTTGAAFLANGISIIPAIADFGVFMCIIVVANYALVITFFPALVVIWFKWFGEKQEQKDMDRRKTRREDKEAELRSMSGGEEGSDSGDEDPKKKLYDSMRPLERFFHFQMANFLNTHRPFVLAFFGVLIIIFVSFAAQLEPDDEPTQFVPKDFPILRYIDARDERFLQLSQTSLDDTIQSVVLITFVWGLAPPYVSGGHAVFDEDFDMSSPEVQEYLLEVCEDTRLDEHREFVIEGEVRCYIDGFKSYVESLGHSFPVTDRQNFTELTQDYVDENPELIENGFIGIELEEPYTVRYVAQEHGATLNPRSAAEVSRRYFDYWTDFLDSHTTPSGGGDPYHTAVRWEDMETEEVLLQTALTGFSLSVTLAFIIILLSTGNWIMAFVSIFTILSIASAILGTMVMMGWKLGIIESVIVTVIIGLAVDYIVHLANSYMEAPAKTRFERTQHALTEMGISVLSASITTVGSALFLTGAVVVFFVQFGIFLALTIFYSALFGFFLLPVILFYVGPEGEQGMLHLRTRFLAAIGRDRKSVV